MTNLIPYILLLPLVGFVALGLFGRALSRPLISLIGCGTIGVAAALAIWQFITMLQVQDAARRTNDIPTLWTWVASGSLRIDFGVLLDPLSAIMLLIVTGVGFLIHVYSIGYMEGDPGYWRFFSFLNLFVFAMTLLVVADNFLFLLVGWAGVGLASFLLIGFWYTRPSAVAAARKAFVVNVIGDFGLLLAIFLIFGAFGTLTYARVLSAPITPAGADAHPPLIASQLHGVMFPTNPAVAAPGVLTAIALLLFVAAAAKSAQLPLHVWLPDAMEGPTPVSALIHAATMVTAGVYLVARASALFTAAPNALPIVGIVGGATALFAATIACVQTDIKRVLAYSTMSQLGYMFMGEAAGGFSTGIFHLTTHAYFKALLFMAAGAVIHALGGEQDIRKMGGLRRAFPTTFLMFICGGLALAAIFPFAGFWSKDAILGAVLQRATTDGPGWYALYAIGLLTAALTGFYIFRLVFVVFWGDYRGGPILAAHGAGHEPHPTARAHASNPLARVHEAGPAMRYPMLALAALSLLGGLYGTPWADWIGGFLEPVVHGSSGLATDNPLLWLSLVAGLVAALIGIAIAWARYGARQAGFAPSRNPLVALLYNAYYVDALYNALFVQPVVWFGRAFHVSFEEVALDGGSRGVAGLFAGVSKRLRSLQTGYARNYALAIFLGAALILAYFLYQMMRS